MTSVHGTMIIGKALRGVVIGHRKADPVPVNTVERPGAGAEFCRQDLYPGDYAAGEGLFLFLIAHAGGDDSVE